MTYFIKRKIYRWLFKLLRRNPAQMPMVQYWKTKNSIPAKVTTNKQGEIIMIMEGEKEPFPGFPRGYLLFGSLSKLKHEIKTKLFNDSWWALEQNVPRETVIKQIKEKLEQIAAITETAKYDMIPPQKMPRAVKEIWRAMAVIEKESPKIEPLKKALTYILTEDDAYRFRLQWIIQLFNPSSWLFKILFRDPIKDWEIALEELENAEVIGDMKERVRLFKRISLLLLEDKRIKELFIKLCKEMNWKKLKLSKADKYHLRGKYFLCDLDKFEY